MSSRDLHILFVGSVLSDAECLSNVICNAAGNKFQKKFAAALGKATGRMVDLLAYEPARMFPKGKKIVYRATQRDVGDGLTAAYFGFLNLPLVKQWTQMVTLFVSLVRWHLRHRSGKRIVIVFNVFAPHAMALLLARAVCGGRTIALVADLPHGLYSFAGTWGLVEKLDFEIQLRSMKRFDGIIGLTAMIAADFAPGLPALVVEGGVDVNAVAAPRKVSSDDRVILFSGTLNEVNGTRLMLQAFARTTDPSYRLRVFGRGPLEQLVADAAAADPRIEYRGHRPNEEILDEQRNAMVLLNPRPSGHPITRYTFPSKLHEYMMSGRPVITTRLPGIPETYYPHLYLLDPESPEGLAALIDEVCHSPAEQLDSLGASAREFVVTNKSWLMQARRVADFIDVLPAR